MKPSRIKACTAPGQWSPQVAVEAENMTFENSAKKIILTCMSNSAVLSAQVRQFRAQLVGHAKVMTPKRDEGAGEKFQEWLRTNAEKADLVIVFFLSSRTARIDTPATLSDGAVQQRLATELLQVTAPELAALPGEATVHVAVFDAADRAALPTELRPYRCFDLSSNDAREALLCTVAHDPVRPKRVSAQEAAGAIGKVVIGHAATVVGNFDKTREFFIQNVNETVGLALHYSMILVVVVLLFTGYLSLLRLFADSVAPLLKTERFGFAQLRAWIERLPGRRSRWIQLLAAAGAAAIVILTVQFLPKRLDVDTAVAQQLHDWAKRLEASQIDSGGIREHRYHGVGQAWVTAQTMAGLLSAREHAKIAAADVQRAVAFLERTRIADVRLKPDAKEKLSADLAPVLPQADFSKLPDRFTNVAMAVGAVSRLGGRGQLSPETMHLVFVKTGEHFTIAESQEGWGYLEQFDAGITEITAWVVVAQVQSLRTKDRAGWSEEQRSTTKRRIKANIASVNDREIPGEGSYSPVNDTSEAAFGRTYSTIMVLWAMAEAVAPDLDIYDSNEQASVQRRIGTIVDWLDRKAEPDGWKVNPSNPVEERPFVGLTNQTLCVLARTPSGTDTDRERLKKVKRSVLEKARTWRSKGMGENARAHDSDRYLYPTRHVVESSTFLWYPWSVCAMRALSTDPALTAGERQAAARAHKDLRARVTEFGRFVQGEYNYIAAEGLIGFTWPVGHATERDTGKH
jgi:hypothetical protein